MSTTLPSKIRAMLNTLNEDQLQLLCDQAWERMELLRRQEDLRELSHFHVGDQVVFSNRREQLVSGTIIRLNQRTATLRTNDGRSWRVSPHLLSPIITTPHTTPLDVE